MFFKLLIFLVFQILLVFSKNLNENLVRKARWIEPYTHTIVQTKLLTSYVPSSCVQVDSTLPPCRNLRYLKFPSFTSNPKPEYKENIQDGNEVQVTKLGWGEYLGLYAPTVTVMNTKIQVTHVQDPRILLTFAVKGCRPLRLPMDLDLCKPENIPPPIQEILPTSRVPSHLFVGATVQPEGITEAAPEAANFNSVGSINELVGNNGNVEGIQSSTLEPEEHNGNLYEPTQELP